MKPISIVIPVRNERESVQPLFEKLAAALEEIGRPHRIIVVDGFSTDGTVESIRRYVDGMPIEIIELGENLGLGGALDTGLERALEGSDIIVTLDGDDSHDPRTIAPLVDRLEQGFDVVVASRFKDGGRQVGVAPHRRLLSRCASTLLRLLFPIGSIKDYSSGYRAYASAALKRVRETSGCLIAEEGFSCQLELMLGLRASGARGSEVPLELRYDLKHSPSKMDVSRTAGRYFVLIGRNLPYARGLKKPRRPPGVGSRADPTRT